MNTIIFYRTPILFGFMILCFFIIALRPNGSVMLRNFSISIIPEMQPVNNRSVSDFIQIFTVFLSTLLVASLFCRLGIDVHHQGFLFNAAVNVSEGKMLFKDIYFHYGALTALLQGLAVYLFGKHLLVIQLLTALFYALTAVFSWLIWRRFLPSILCTTTCIVWICFAPYLSMEYIFLPWSSVYSLFFMMFSLYMLILYIEKDQWVYLFFTGIATGLTFWSRQTVGLLLFTSLIGYFITLHVLHNCHGQTSWGLFVLPTTKHEKRSGLPGFSYKKNRKSLIKKLLLLSAGGVCVSIAFFVWLILNGATYDWWVQNFSGLAVWAFGNAQAGESPFFLHILRISSCLLPNNVWTIFPLLTILLLFRYFLNFSTAKTTIQMSSTILLAFLFVCVASWGQYFPVPCHRHFYWASTPIFGLLAYYFLWATQTIGELSKSDKKLSAIGLCCILCFVIAILAREASINVKQGIKKIHEFNIKLSRPEKLAGMMVSSKNQEMAFIEIETNLNEYFKKNPESSLISLSGLNVLFLTFHEKNESFSPIPTYRFDSDFFSSIYQYRNKLNQCIRLKKPLIFADKPWIIEGYDETRTILTEPTSPYDTGSWYLYAPKNQDIHKS